MRTICSDTKLDNGMKNELAELYTAILSKYLADKIMQIMIPAATGENKMFISLVPELPTEKPVMAMSPMTRPRVPASVASSPKRGRRKK